ncbi:beta-galactosidase [halophilic archaeon]|nr:beta-galactosidase [halophilic archaeon]
MKAFARDPTVELSEDWEFTVDPREEGVDAGWYEKSTRLPESRTVSVPHVWQEQEELRDYTGTAWYKRKLSHDLGTGERALLRFGAVDYAATVWVNGTRVGANQGGYLPFQVDVTEALTGGEDVIAVRVHDPEDLREIPHGKQGPPWYTRVSGIWQPVELTVVPERRVVSSNVTPDLEADVATFDIDVTDAAVGNGLTATVEVTQDGRTLGTRTTELSDTASTVTVGLDSPTYWSPETPALCDFDLTLTDAGETVDTYQDYFGMRSVSVEDGDWYLNGEPLRVRGGLDQAYYPDTFHWPSDSTSYREEIEIAKELGFNMLRKHIKPAHPQFVELADRLGVLVWEEPANPDLYTDDSKRAVREQFEGMVERDYNRPSVVVWSLYNEEWGIGINQHDFPDRDDPVRLWHDEEKQAYLAKLYEEARNLDPTRLVCDNSGWAHVATDINDYHEYFVVPDRDDAWRDRLADIVSNPEENYATTAHDDPDDVPLVMSEFGTWGLPAVSTFDDHYDGDPHWFDHTFLDGLKKPAGVKDRFAESPVADTYADLDELAADWQRREFESVANIIADMRIHDDVSGYVITEFTDIEWEFNGILDYVREDKSFVEAFAGVNGPTMVRVEPADRTLSSGDRFRADVVVVNDRNEILDTTLRWNVAGTTETVEVDVPRNGTRRLADAIDVAMPAVSGVESVPVEASLEGTQAQWSTDLAVVGNVTSGGAAVYASDEAVRTSLSDLGYDTVADLSAADAAVVVAGDEPEGDELRAFAADGGHVVALPNRDGDVDETLLDDATVRDLPEQESWNLCASFIYQTLFDGVPRVPGWAFDDLYPYAYVTSTTAADEVEVGYTEGWIANSGAIVTSRSHEDGDITFCTLRVSDSLDDQPVATAILAELLP